jgi:hypothetical protein
MHMLKLLRNVWLICIGCLISVPCRRDGPLASMVQADDKSPVEDLIHKAKLMLHPQRGSLAVICDDDDILFVKSVVSSAMPPLLHLHHSTMFAFMASAGDDRFSAYHSVRVCKVYFFSLPTQTLQHVTPSLLTSICLVLQGKINVVVGFAYKKYNRDIANELSKSSTFFTDFLGVCGAVTISGKFNAPYSSREREAVGLDITLSQTAKRRITVLPKEFYEALLKAVSCPPDQKG